jgi:undecaprenyl phosphate N,N'-diacetylbacillosamine 1-phosphate transferase
MYKSYFKRPLDFTLALLGLFLLSPVLVISTIVLCFANQGKPFFFQKRPGKNGAIFQIIKFKTMNDKKNLDGSLISDAERLTAIGSFLRKTSLDEIPQLINVLKGEMSLVGPRPLLPQYLALYSEEQKRRHEIRPGITGWAQVNGRNAIGWNQKFRYDVYYVDNQSFLLDMKIIILTVKKVLVREDISSTTSATMEVFTGNKLSDE